MRLHGPQLPDNIEGVKPRPNFKVDGLSCEPPYRLLTHQQSSDRKCSREGEGEYVHTYSYQHRPVFNHVSLKMPLAFGHFNSIFTHIAYR